MKRFQVSVLMFLCIVLAVEIGSAQSSKSHSESGQALHAGLWGGEDVRMEVTANGASMEFGCSQGEISSPIHLDSNGRFQAKGTLTSNGPGPTTIADSSQPNATYSGELKGNTLLLKIRVDGESEPRTFRLIQGKNTKLLGCK